MPKSKQYSTANSFEIARCPLLVQLTTLWLFQALSLCCCYFIQDCNRIYQEALVMDVKLTVHGLIFVWDVVRYFNTHNHNWSLFCLFFFLCSGLCNISILLHFVHILVILCFYINNNWQTTLNMPYICPMSVFLQAQIVQIRSRSIFPQAYSI